MVTEMPKHRTAPTLLGSPAALTPVAVSPGAPPVKRRTIMVAAAALYLPASSIAALAIWVVARGIPDSVALQLTASLQWIPLSAFLGLPAIGWTATLFAMRPSLSPGAAPHGQRAILAGLLGGAMVGLGALISDWSILPAVVTGLGAGAASAYGMFFPWLARRN